MARGNVAELGGEKARKPRGPSKVFVFIRDGECIGVIRDAGEAMKFLTDNKDATYSHHEIG